MYKVHKATDKKGNDKNDALMLLEVPRDADFFLMELKIRDKKDIARLANLIDCDLGIITSVHSRISERANIDVLAGVKAGGEIALTAEENEPSLICRTDIETKTVSVKNEEAELYAKNIRTYKERTVFDICGKGVYIEKVEIHFTGIENVCERASFMLAKSEGTKKLEECMVLPKSGKDGVTVSIMKIDWSVRFE